MFQAQAGSSPFEDDSVLILVDLPRRLLTGLHSKPPPTFLRLVVSRLARIEVESLCRNKALFSGNFWWKFGAVSRKNGRVIGVVVGQVASRCALVRWWFLKGFVE